MLRNFALLVLVLTARSPLPQLNLRSRRMRDAPEIMDRGSAASHRNTLYCISQTSYTIFSFHIDQDEWERHATCPYRSTALTVINGYLTTIGGQDERGRTTNKVLSRKGGRWEEEVPPMAAARCRHAVVNNGHTVVVAGGAEEKEESVEVFTGSSWSSVAPLPLYLAAITATLCGDQLYVMDWVGHIYTSSLTVLLSTRRTDTPSTKQTWRPLTTPPVRWSTLSTIGSLVVVVGGWTGGVWTGGVWTGDVHGLVGSGWTRVGRMSTERELPIVGLVGEDKMVVVGGYSHSVELLYY